jgi:hypothetical protein
MTLLLLHSYFIPKKIRAETIAYTEKSGTRMLDRIALYPILGVTGDWLDEPFDLSVLPATILPNVTIEDAKALFHKKSFDLWKSYLAKRELESLQRVRFAIVCRYSDTYSDPNIESNAAAEKLVRYVGACLRLIRPMQQDASFIRGRFLSDSTLEIQHFEIPVEATVPAVQKLFRLRNRDVVRLQRVIPTFMTATNGDFWKFRMALELHEWGHFIHAPWKGRFSLWSSALEALYTSNSTEHKGSLVAKERIKWFLGPKTPIYESGDIQIGQPELTIKIEDVVDDLYELRNCVAHGDKTPDKFFAEVRTEYTDSVCLAEALTEAASRIIRGSLLRILEDNLLNDFANGPASEAYFASVGLTRSALYAKLRPKP